MSYASPLWIDNAPPSISPSNLQALTDEVERSQTRIGDVIFSRQTTISHFLACDGSTFTPATYPLLYAALGSAMLPSISGAFIKAE